MKEVDASCGMDPICSHTCTKGVSGTKKDPATCHQRAAALLLLTKTSTTKKLLTEINLK